MLVALDGSEAADRALEYAIDLRREDRGELILCSAVDKATIAAASGAEGMSGIALTTIDDMGDAAKLILERASARATAAGAPSSIFLLEGGAPAVIVTCAKEQRVDAIVMGTHGSRGLDRMILGSTADGVLRATHVPTFVIRRSASRVPVALAPKSDPEPRASFGCVLVALDPSEAAEAALAFALDFATAKRSRLKFCTVVQVGDFVRSAAMYGYDPTDPIEDMRATAATHLDATLAAARARGLEADSTVVDGHPSHALLDAAAACGADLIAIGTHGRRGLDRLLFGSVAESVVARSPVPVVVIHTPARA